MSTHYKSLTKRTNPETIPIFPLNGTVLLPACDLPLNIFEPRYLNMVDDALKSDRLIGMIQSVEKTQSTHETGTQSGQAELVKIGGLGRIIQFSETEDGRYLIVLKGLKRFRYLGDVDHKTPYRRAKISFDDFIDDAERHTGKDMPSALSGGSNNDRAALTLAMKSFAKALGVNVDWKSLAEIPIANLVDQAAMISPFKPADKQSLLEASDTNERRRLLIGLMHLYATNSGNMSGQKNDSDPQMPLQ